MRQRMIYHIPPDLRMVEKGINKSIKDEEALIE